MPSITTSSTACFRRGNRHAVLVFFAVPDQAHIRGFDLQRQLLDLLNFCLPIMADFSDDPHDS